MDNDLTYAMKQGAKALDFIREAPKRKDGKLKDRMLAKAASDLLSSMRDKDSNRILIHARFIFGRA